MSTDFLSFKLSDDFVSAYTEREVSWGFPIHNGLSLGELTYISKYSRIKEDGTKERWYETCRRVIEGMFSIQKDWCKNQRTPWNDHKAQRAAKDAYERMFVFKWTPPGRGMWAMGTHMVNGLNNSAALYNCLSGDQRIVTDQGEFALEDLLGKTVNVLTESGWQKGDIGYFGQQEVQKVRLVPASLRHRDGRKSCFVANRSNLSHEVTATKDHRWVVADANEVAINGAYSVSTSVTTDLQVGDVVPGVRAHYNLSDSDLKDWLDGARHGAIFGDGTKQQFEYADGDHSLTLRACGSKLQDFVAGDNLAATPLFDRVTYPPSFNGDPNYSFKSSENFKLLPEGKSAEYNAGFLAGWVHADAALTEGSWVLCSQHADAESWIRANAPAAGFILTGINEDSVTETNFGPRSGKLMRFTLRRGEVYWKVAAVERTGETADVYCATVPATSTFALSGGILTGNCAFLTTAKLSSHSKYEAVWPFSRLMEMSMWGIGVGFDTKGAGNITLHKPEGEAETFVVGDTREDWADSIGRLLVSFFLPNQRPVIFDYSKIRPAGSPLKTFGGRASGPGPLVDLHQIVRDLLTHDAGKALSSRNIVDVMNLIGKAVVAGGARRSAELSLGDIDDIDYINLKNWELPENAARTGADGWAWMSNNSVFVDVESDLTNIIESVKVNGEPGIVWYDTMREYGRIADPKDYKDMKAAGVNPCAEITLEGGGELCCLAETYINNHDNLDDYLATCKVAMLYAKTVTLMPTPWPETNEIMVRNRRIGVSMTGTAQFADAQGWHELRKWQDTGYQYICEKDDLYSEWLGVRPSIRKTTSKPAGSTSLLAGCAPGVHWPTSAGLFLRRMRFSVMDPLVDIIKKAGYHIEPDIGDPKSTVVAEFPVDGLDMRSEREVSVWEKAELAAFTSRWWADNAVSVTVSFRPDEAEQIGPILRSKAGQFKTISFLPLQGEGESTYPQAPFGHISEVEAVKLRKKLKTVDLAAIYDSGKTADAAGEKFCNNDSCEIPQ